MRISTPRLLGLFSGIAVASGAFLPWQSGLRATQLPIGAVLGAPWDAANSIAGSMAVPLVVIALVIAAAAGSGSRVAAGVCLLTLVGLLTMWLAGRAVTLPSARGSIEAGVWLEFCGVALLLAAEAAPQRRRMRLPTWIRRNLYQMTLPGNRMFLRRRS